MSEMSGEAPGTPLCVALTISAVRTLIYVLEGGSKIDSTVRVVEGNPGDQFAIRLRHLRGQVTDKRNELRELGRGLINAQP